MEPKRFRRRGIGLLAIAAWIFLFSGPGMAEEAKITNTLGMTFIRVAPGTFSMGSPLTEKHRDPDEPLHEQVIQTAFYLQETEVTLKQWQTLMGKSWFNRRKGTPDTPVTRVSWHDCKRFIEKLNKKDSGTYRLPTEAEWEYACRAGTTTAYSFGETIDCSKAMFGNTPQKDSQCVTFYKKHGIPVESPAPARTFPPNPWGFYDMHGNVWEWCEDAYGGYLSSGAGGGYSGIDSDSRVRRGGSFYKHAIYLRSANRTYAHPDAKFKTTGFRLVLEAAE